MGIRTKVLILIFAVILLAGGVTSFVSRTVSMNTVENEISDHLTTTAQSRANHIETVLDNLKKTTDSLKEQVYLFRSSVPEMAIAEVNQITGFILVEMASSNNDISEAILLDEEGTICASSNFGLLGQDMSQDETFTKSTNGKVFLNDAPFDGVTGDFSIITASSMADMANTLGITWYGDIVSQITMDMTGLGNTGEVYIVNEDGFMITPSRFVNTAISDYNFDFKKDQADQVLAEGRPSDGFLHTYTDSNYWGIKVIRSHREIPDIGWNVVVEKSVSEAFSPVSNMTQTMIFILLGLLAAGAIAVLAMSRTITRPLMKLHEGVIQILNGNLDHHVGNKSKDEIGHLSRAFDEMTSNVRVSQERLEEYSAGLEEMVAERTEELTTTNEELNRQMEERVRAETKVKEQYNAIQVHAYELEATNDELRATQEKLVDTNTQLQNAVDDLKSSHEQLLQSQKLAAIGELVSGVAHELNNPLMAIQGNAYILLDDVEDEINREGLEVIYSETKRASEIVQNLLSFSRKQDSVKTQVDINECVDSIMKLRTYELSVNNIELISELGPNLPFITGDSQRLRQVFLNLINNSAQAIQQGPYEGKIIIRTHQTTDQMVSVVFEDDGPGIAPDVIDRVFEPFFTTKDVGKGTGLGLSICYGIIKDHGGKMYAKSNFGEGATFYIELPVASEVANASSNSMEV